MPDFRAELDAAVEAARSAGELIRNFEARERVVRQKGSFDLVTEADLAAQELIVGRLGEVFPEYAFLAEEDDPNLDDLNGVHTPRWIIDPLDGTTNFAHGVPPYAVSIVLQDAGGELVVGVVYEIGRDEMFSTRKGGGTTLNGRPVTASETNRLHDALLTTGFPFREFWYVDEYLSTLGSLIGKTRGVRRPGSAATDLAYVAAGRFDGYFEAGLAPWDVAAGVLLVEEAGGRVSGLVQEIDPLMSGQILATNGNVYDELIPLMANLGLAAQPRTQSRPDEA